MPEIESDKAVQLLNDWQDISFAQIAIVCVVAYALIVLVRRVLPFLADRGPSRIRLYVLAAVPIIRLIIMTVATVWLIRLIFRITFENFLVIAGAASVAIGFAFKEYVSSLIAGVVAVFERPYRQGDWIKVGDDYGEVQSVGLRTVTLRTANDDIVAVPHQQIWTDNVSNSNDGSQTLMCVADFYVDPNHESAKIREALREVAITSAYLEYEKPVRVIVSEKPFATHYRIKAYPFDLRDQFLFISDLTVRGKEAIRDAGGRFAAAGYAAAD